MGSCDGEDIWENSREPRHLPVGGFSEHSLHIDADMNLALTGRPVPKFIVLRHCLKSQAFTQHERETRAQVKRLDRVFKIIGKPARGKTCAAINGIAEGL